MGVIAVPGQSGRNYSVNIAGDAPTPEEQAKIDAYISQQETASPFYNPPSTAAPEEEGGGFMDGLGTAFGVGVDQLQQSYGSALEGIGSLVGSDGLKGYGKEVAEANAKEAAEGGKKLTGRDDVDGLGSAAAFFGQTLAQNAPQIATSLGGAYTGGAAGSFLGPFGTAGGAIIGGIAANLPFFYGQNRERQKEAIDKGLKVEVDEGAAALAAIPQAALDAVVDRFMIGKFLSPEALRAGGIFTRAIKSGIAGVVTEVPTEVGQQVIERYQAGLPLDDDEAIREYEDAAIAAGMVGGTLAGTTGALSKDSRKTRAASEALKASTELDTDLGELGAEADIRRNFGMAALVAPKAPPSGEGRTGPVAPPLALPPPDPTKAPTPSPTGVSGGAQPAPKTYGPEAYVAAVEKVQSLGRYSAPAIQSAVAKATGEKVPLAVVREIAKDMQATGLLVPDAKATGGYKVGKVPENKSELEASLVKTMRDLNQTITEDRKAREKAAQDMRRAQQTGTNKQVKEEAVRIDALDAKIAAAEDTKLEVSKRLAGAGQAVQVPTQERPGSPMAGTSVVAPITKVGPEAQAKAVDDRTANLKAALAQREARLKQITAQVKKLEAEKKRGPLPTEFARQLDGLKTGIAEDKFAISDLKDRIKNPAPAIAAERRAMEAGFARKQAAEATRVERTPVYNGQQQKVFNALRKRLTNLGLNDVRLVAEKVIRPDLAAKGDLVEGTFDVQEGNRLIALAMSIYDPKLTDQQLFNAVSEVMNHEVIHALRNMGLFTDAEWNILTDLARRQKYMKTVNGKPTERGYSYFDRAKRMYGSSTPDIQMEEAVAEMFRDQAAGRLKVGGKPRSLMERIKNFFKALWKSHEDAGLTDPNAIFEGIRLGKIGARERKAAAPQQETSKRQSMVETPAFKKWFANSKVVNPDGTPKVVYHGTAIPKTFFREEGGGAAGVGAYFSEDRTVAEDYAEMDAIEDGDAPEVMEVYLSIRNPKTMNGTDIQKISAGQRDALVADGYDGAYSPESGEYVAFKPTQIKSAQNTGTFDPANPDIRYSKVTDLGQKREEKKLQIFHKDLKDDIGTRVQSMREAAQQAIEAGVFDGYEVGDVLRGKRPLKITGRFMRKWKPTSMTMEHFDRMKAKPSITEVDGTQYIPILRYTVGREEDPDYEEGELYLDMVKATGMQKMGGLRSVERFSSVNTNAFKDWFGDSKITDSLGNPVQVFHGTRFGDTISEFKPMTHFGTVQAANERIKATRQWEDQYDHESIYPLFISMKNPLDVGREVEVWRDDADMIRQIASVLFNKSFDATADDEATLRDAADKFRTLANLAAERKITPDEARELTAELLNALRYDGIVYTNTVEDRGSRSYVVANSNQIKSVFNYGTFDPNNKDIRYSAIETPAFKKWFGESKVVDEDGTPKTVYHGTDKAGFFVFDTDPSNPKTQGTGAFFAGDLGLARTYTGTNKLVEFPNKEEIMADPGKFGFDVREWFGKVSVVDPDGYDVEVPGTATMFDDEAVRPTLEQVVDDWLTSDRFGEEYTANYDVYLKMENPYIYDANGKAWNELGEEEVFVIKDGDGRFVDIFYDEWSADSELENLQEDDPARGYAIRKEMRPGEQTTDDIVREIRENNDGGEYDYDGVIFKNIDDQGSYGSASPGDVYVVFKPEQIKSARNYGTFDPKNKDIRYSALKAVEDDASPEDRRTLQQAQENLLRYSKAPNLQLLPAPVRTEDGEETRIFGKFRGLDGRLFAVFLPEGEHKNFGTGTGVGFGMAHIKARGHDRELSSNSKFPSVEEAVFRMLKEWDKQGQKDGEKITASKTQDGFELRWANKMSHGSPPLRLVLWQVPKLPVMYVKTFFPELPAAKRMRGSSMELKGDDDARRQEPERKSTIPAASGDRAGRHQGGSLAPLAGAPTVTGASGPDQRLTKVAEVYAKKLGFTLKRQSEYVKVDEDRAKRIAAAYDAMKHDPANPFVAEAYENLIQQTKAQYEALVDAGYEFSFFDDATDPYDGNPWNAMRDLRANKKMAVYGTYSGYGTAGLKRPKKSANPLLADTGIRWKDQNGEEHEVLANDLFRAVHDTFCHGIEGAGFRADGEENAWQAHVRLFTGSAVAALTSETRGQNFWLNFGPYGEQNRNAKVEDTIFAEQKIGLLPEWTWQEGRAGDMSNGTARRNSMLSIRPSLSPVTKQNMGKAQMGMMYAKSADLIAGILNLKGRGMREDKARRLADGILRRFQDNMLPVGRMVQELSAAGMTITDAMDPYLQEELMHGRVGHKIAENQKALFAPVVEAIKRIDVKVLDLDRLKRASNDAAKDGKGFAAYMLNDTDSPRTALADIYLYAKHAKERNKFIREVRDPENLSGSGMTDAEADAILTWFNRLTGENAKAVADLDVGIRAIVADTNKVRLDAGLISTDAVEKSPWKNYVPLRGVYDPDGDMADALDEYRGPPGRPRLGAKGKEDPMVKGRFDYASDLVANIFTQNQNAVLRGERNKVGQSFLTLLRGDKEMTEGYATILDRRPMTRAVNAQGKNVDVVDMQAIRAPDMLVVKEDGRETFVRFSDERLAGALNGQNGLGPSNGNLLIAAMGKVNRYLASINTSYNPEFMVTNMLRDLQTAGVNVNQFEKDGMTKAVLGGLKGALMGIRRSIRNEDDNSEWSKIYKDFVAAGGQNATNQFNSLSEEMAGIKKLLGDVADGGIHGKWNKVKHGMIGKGAGSLLQLVEDYNTVIENGIRVSTYKALLDKGFTRERAAQAARNVTVNFAKGGDYRQFMNAMYLFYNASLQGSFALLNAAVRSGRVRKMWGAVLAVGILQDQLNALLSEDDDDGEKIYDKIPAYVLEHNMILPDPFGLTDRSYISIPMPYGLNMAVNAGRSMSRAARGTYDPSEAATSIFGTLLDTLNPIGGAESFANFAAPTIADPFIDLVENEDFANKPIFKENLVFDRTPTPDSQMYWSTTSPSAIWIAKNLNDLTGGNAVRSGFADISPDVMEFWFDFLTGGVGRFVQRGVELPANVYEHGLGDDLIRNVPFLRKAVGSVSDTEDMGTYIDKASRVLLAGEEYKQARETGNAEWARETKERYSEELRLVPRVKRFESMLRKISKQKGIIEENPRLPDSQKKVLLERLEQRRKEVLMAASKLMIDM